ncbi:MAG TPA: hypothetical protein VFB89_00965 [Gemmatimonadales bacterium]|nr:hypothetical protein [Gemmatimonadales bacterium]
MLPRSIAAFLAVALVSCGATGTEPTLSDAKAGNPVAKHTVSFIQAQAFANFIPTGTVNWELFVARYVTKGERPDSTILIVDHCPQDCEVTDPSEVTVVFRGSIPDKDFKVGRWQRDWELHTAIPGQGRIDVTFHNEGNWSPPSGTQSIPSGLSGTVVGVNANGGFVTLFFDPRGLPVP